jgi:hypothetical protein
MLTDDSARGTGHNRSADRPKRTVLTHFDCGRRKVQSCLCGLPSRCVHSGDIPGHVLPEDSRQGRLTVNGFGHLAAP